MAALTMAGLCTLTALSWTDAPLPIPGQYLKARRGRTAFLVIEVLRPSRPDCRYVARFRCERRDPAGLAPDDVVIGWRWRARG